MLIEMPSCLMTLLGPRNHILDGLRADTGVYLDFLTRGMVAMLGGSRPNPFCKSATVGLRTAYSC